MPMRRIPLPILALCCALAAHAAHAAEPVSVPLDAATLAALPRTAVAPGQSAVLYGEDGTILCGGIIEK